MWSTGIHIPERVGPRVRKIEISEASGALISGYDRINSDILFSYVVEG